MSTMRPIGYAGLDRREVGWLVAQICLGIAMCLGGRWAMVWFGLGDVRGLDRSMVNVILYSAGMAQIFVPIMKLFRMRVRKSGWGEATRLTQRVWLVCGPMLAGFAVLGLLLARENLTDAQRAVVVDLGGVLLTLGITMAAFPLYLWWLSKRGK